MGGDIRVGLEDNLYPERGILATDARLVERARKNVEGMGAKILCSNAARNRLGLLRTPDSPIRQPSIHDRLDAMRIL